MKWLKNMSTKELREAYEKVTNEEDLQEFKNHCQNIGVQIYKVVKGSNKEADLKDFTSSYLYDNKEDYITTIAMANNDVREAVKGLVEHSLKMMDK